MPESPKMRTIKEAVAEIKAADANSAITIYAVKRWAKEGKLPSIRAGNKLLVNLNALERYLSGDAQSDTSVARSSIVDYIPLVDYPSRSG